MIEPARGGVGQTPPAAMTFSHHILFAAQRVSQVLKPAAFGDAARQVAMFTEPTRNRATVLLNAQLYLLAIGQIGSRR
jgi:hypothetical protein